MKVFRAPQTRSTRTLWMLEEAGINYDMELIVDRCQARAAFQSAQEKAGG